MRKVRVKKKPDGLLLFGGRGFRTRVCLVLLGICVFVLDGSAAAAQQKAKNVLVVFSSITGDKAFLEVTEPAVRARVPGVNFIEAFLANDRNVGEESRKTYEGSQAETFRRVYARTKLDLVVAVSPQAFNFALDSRDQIFPGVPIVYSGGLGLVSMQERVHIVHGRFSVESQPGKGTQILVAVPLVPETEPTSDRMSKMA